MDSRWDYSGQYSIGSFCFFFKNKDRFAAFINLLIAIFISTWAISSLIAESDNVSLDTNNLANKMAYGFAFLAVASYVAFCRRFSLNFAKSRWSTRMMLIFVLGSLILAMASFTEYIAGTVEYSSTGNLVFIQGSFVAIYTLILLGLFITAVRFLLIRVKQGNYAQKNQARFIIFGLCVGIVLAITTNVIIPSFVPEFKTSFIAPILIFILGIITSYVLVNQKPLDIRPLAVRTSAVFLLFLTLGAIYGLVLFGLNNMFIADNSLPGAVVVFYALVMVTLGFLLHPLYRTYNLIFGQLFLRKVYEPQTVINQLNAVLVANLKMNALIKEVQKVVKRNLDTKFTIFKLHKKTSYYSQGLRKKLDKEELAHIDVELLNSGLANKQVVSLRDIVLDDRANKLYERMVKNDISVIGIIKHGSLRLGTVYISGKNSELPYTNQDIDILKIVVDQTGLAIQNSILFHQVSSFNSKLKEEVADATSELRSTNHKLKAIDKSKDEFISIASHQLRTPLTTIKGYLSMFLEGELGTIRKDQRNALQESYKSTQRISFLISDLLNLTRLTSGNLQLEPKPVNLSSLIKSELPYVEEQAMSRNISINFKNPKNFPDLMIDEAKTRQVVLNFIDNALRYTPDKGQVDIELKKDKNHFTFTITDNGIGVSKAEQKHLFGRFYRAKNAKGIRPDGTGIGLFMAKKLISAQGGAILFESEEGKGSTFGFSFNKKHLANPDSDED